MTADTSRFFGAHQPPITILVPYPVIVPIPIPIPIPMPLVEFMRATQLKMDMDKLVAEQNNNTDKVVTGADEPLDCSKTKEMDTFHHDCDSPPLSQLEEMIETEEHQIIISNNDPINDESNNVLEHVDNSNATTNVEDDMLHQKRLPKFKITRLNSKRVITSTSPISSNSSRTPTSKNNTTETGPVSITISVASPDNIASNAKHDINTASVAATSNASSISCSETSRPLRKRKRVVDCDYLRLKDDDNKKKI